MTEQTNLEDKIRSLLNHWEGFTRGEPHHVSAEGVLRDLRDLLPDSPLPDPLFGARATHPEHGEGIVISHFPDGDGTVRFACPYDGTYDGTWSRWVDHSTLTFHTPDHPEYLETEEDYRTAPEGTIVAEDDAVPVVLLLDGLWRNTGGWTLDHGDMANTPCRVLRWGWQA